MDTLYLGPSDNGFGHIIFKLQTKQTISVPKVTFIPIALDVIDQVNKISKKEGEKEGIICTDLFENIC